MMVVMSSAAVLPDAAVARPLEGHSGQSETSVSNRSVAADTGRVGLWWPTPGAIVEPWDAPAGPYAAGHRGVDLRVRHGQVVKAMGHGRVAWAGVVAGTAWVSVDHRGGLRSTVGPMATIVVSVGDVVEQGVVVGTATGVAHPGAGGPGGPSTGRDGLHVSTRIDGVYVDPTGLIVGLVPTLLPPAP